MGTRNVGEVIQQAQELDDRRQAQITQQIASINRYQTYMEQHDLVADFLRWQKDSVTR